MFLSPYLPTDIAGQVQPPPGRLRSKFTVAEDALLQSLVAERPHASWAEIAAMFPDKSVRQVRDRYRNYLNPQLNHFPWSPAEDALLQEKFAIHGPQWSILRQFFINRSDVNIKNRWSTILSKSHRDHFELPKVTNPEPEPPEPPHAPEVPDVLDGPGEVRRASFDFDPCTPYVAPSFDLLYGEVNWSPY
jgi:hypothetical protein